ncbi:MAG: hypothetical protein ACM3QZ_08825 [Solirubrobacterales bacterium]
MDPIVKAAADSLILRLTRLQESLDSRGSMDELWQLREEISRLRDRLKEM